MDMVKSRDIEMLINSKANIRTETELAIQAFLAQGGRVLTIRSRKNPKTPTAKGKNKGAFNATKIFAVGA
jgi:hypothetical protein